MDSSNNKGLYVGVAAVAVIASAAIIYKLVFSSSEDSTIEEEPVARKA